MSLLPKQRKLTAQTMARLEREVDQSTLAGFHRTGEGIEDLIDLAKGYGLDVHMGAKMDGKNRAALVPPNADSSAPNGIIQLQEIEKPSRFDLMHELIHYVFDVKSGPVMQPFYEEISESKEATDPHEREVNYMAAAVLMPRREVYERIREYDRSSPKQDVYLLIKSLQEKYSVSKGSVIMRIQEVRKLASCNQI